MAETRKWLTLVGVKDAAISAARALDADGALHADELALSQALLATAAPQSAIFNSLRFSGIVTDADGLIHSFSPRAQRLVGYTAAEVVGQLPMMALHDPQDLRALAAQLSVKFSTPMDAGINALVFPSVQGLADAYALDLLCKDGQGSVFWIEMDLMPDLDTAAGSAAAAGPAPLQLQKEARWRTLLYVEDSLPNLLLVTETEILQAGILVVDVRGATATEKAKAKAKAQ